MASRPVILMICLWLAFLACLSGCDRSAAEPRTIQMQMPPDAERAVITLGSSPANVIGIEGISELKMTPHEDDCGENTELSVEFKDVDGEFLAKEIEEVYIGKSGRIDLTLQFIPITDPLIRVSVAESVMGSEITVSGWNFKPDEDIRIEGRGPFQSDLYSSSGCHNWRPGAKVIHPGNRREVWQ